MPLIPLTRACTKLPTLGRSAVGQMRAMAKFLGIPIDEAKWPKIVEYCSFAWMKAHAGRSTPLGGAFWDAGAQVFINQGVNGRWQERLEVQFGETEAFFDLVLYLAFFIPGIVAMVWAGYIYAGESFAIREHSSITAVGPPI